ncbi:uncharacterized protein [Antedon mediterranea]|uniref:uncharacterized protein n=1 Tax=Antedon mediterranea TaxID=105859 RepID=UPI003AF9BBCE
MNEKLGIRLLNCYGSTETTTISSLTHTDSRNVWNTTGRTVPNTEIQIVDEEGRPVEVGEKGEIWLRSPVAFRGYYGDIEKTKEKITENGWIKTGDLGKLNADGYLTMVGRIQVLLSTLYEALI